ncbi:MAG: PspA/IM30 family protein [Deltaproteobacteria bacterium]|nr:PspA/IM30 family protein [Deltaproteobacteria bacterium]MBW2414157.1 PspA/IM30 family protein [Deltaproteobacteria bacterium]
MSHEKRGLFSRVRNLLRGVFTSWVQDREGENPRAVYEAAIHERIRQYEGLKQAVAGILYMRNKLEAEIRERRGEVLRSQDLTRRAIERGDDDVALELIAQKDHLAGELHRSERELEEVGTEVESAKANLIKFRSEIRSLEREKIRMLAALANARARRRFQRAIEGLSVDSEMKALDSVREQIARLKSEGRLDIELDDSPVQTRIRALRQEQRDEACRAELEELKRRMRPAALPVTEPEPVVHVAN